MANGRAGSFGSFMRSKPLISVIIPTIEGRDLLCRAIDSCLHNSIYADETEVVVIARGENTSWNTICQRYSRDDRVHFHFTKNSDQNISRNIGIIFSQGYLIRFLDDDDYLIPEAAALQYSFMLEKGVDLCSGGAEIRDQDNYLCSVLRQPDTSSVYVAALGCNRLQLPFTHVYRRSSLAGMSWPVGLRQSEDIVWLVRYVTAAPRTWARFDQPVGVWYQHDGARQSLNRPSGSVHESTAQALIDAQDQLLEQGRWNAHLAAVTSRALWELVHRAFAFRPLYWGHVATKAMYMNVHTRPAAPVYRFPILSSLDPRLLLWLLLPKRLVALGWDGFRAIVRGRDYRRTL